MSVAEIYTLQNVCEVERTQLLTILAMSVQNPQLAGFVLTQNRSNFLYVEAKLSGVMIVRIISPLYVAEQGNENIPGNYFHTVMHIDPITRQSFEFADQKPCESNVVIGL